MACAAPRQLWQRGAARQESRAAPHALWRVLKKNRKTCWCTRSDAPGGQSVGAHQLNGKKTSTPVRYHDSPVNNSVFHLSAFMVRRVCRAAPGAPKTRRKRAWRGAARGQKKQENALARRVAITDHKGCLCNVVTAHIETVIYYRISKLQKHVSYGTTPELPRESPNYYYR